MKNEDLNDPPQRRAFEVELKFRVPDPSVLLERIAAMSRSDVTAVPCVDLYLAHPSRDFASSDEAFRLRREGEENRLTYKGPKLPGPTKTREEIEIAYEPGPLGYDLMKRLVLHLGFQPVATVSKMRQTYSVSVPPHQLSIMVDDVEGLGIFAEVETLAEYFEDLVHAQSAVLNLAERLGLTKIEPRSYLRMLLESDR